MKRETPARVPPGSPADQQAGEGDRLDGARLPPQAQAHHAGAGDPVCEGELNQVCPSSCCIGFAVSRAGPRPGSAMTGNTIVRGK